MSARGVAALPQTCCPTVWLWPGQAMYAGPSLNLAPHSWSVWCFATGIGGSLTVTTPDGVTQQGTTLLIPPRLTHQLVCRGGGPVSCYLEPTSVRAEAARRRMSTWRSGIGLGHAAGRPASVLSRIAFPAPVPRPAGNQCSSLPHLGAVGARGDGHRRRRESHRGGDEIGFRQPVPSRRPVQDHLRAVGYPAARDGVDGSDSVATRPNTIDSSTEVNRWPIASRR